GAFVSARETILNTEDRERLVPGAHEDVAVPGAAADIVRGVDVIVAPGLDVAGVYCLALAGAGDPPALGLPAALGAVAERDGNGVCRLVADAQRALALGVGLERPLVGRRLGLRLRGRNRPAGRRHVGTREEEPQCEDRDRAQQQSTAGQEITQ